MPRNGRIVIFPTFSFEITEAAGWEMDGNGVQLGVVGPHCRFCIKHAGVPRESELYGLISAVLRW